MLFMMRSMMLQNPISGLGRRCKAMERVLELQMLDDSDYDGPIAVISSGSCNINSC